MGVRPDLRGAGDVFVENAGGFARFGFLVMLLVEMSGLGSETAGGGDAVVVVEGVCGCYFADRVGVGRLFRRIVFGFTMDTARDVEGV